MDFEKISNSGRIYISFTVRFEAVVLVELIHWSETLGGRLLEIRGAKLSDDARNICLDAQSRRSKLFAMSTNTRTFITTTRHSTTPLVRCGIFYFLSGE